MMEAIIKKLPVVSLVALLGSISFSACGESLLQVYQQAKQNNPELRAAAAKSGEASEMIAQTRGALLPQLNLNGRYGRKRFESHIPEWTQPGQTVTGSLMGANIPVTFPDRREGGHSKRYVNESELELKMTQSILDFSQWSRLSSAKKVAATRALEYQEAQQKLMLDTATHYINVLLALEGYNRVTTEKLALARKLQETQQQHRVGIAPPIDLYHAQAKYDEVLAGEVQSSNELENALERLRQISGHYYRQLNKLDSRVFKPQPLQGTVETWLSAGQQRNLLLLTARLKQSTARENVQGVRTQHLPILQLEAKVEHRREQAAVTTKYRQLSGGVVLRVPLFSGGQVASGVKQAQFELVQASEQLESMYRSVNMETREAYNGVATAISASRAYQQAVKSAQSRLDACEASYRVGTETLVTVLQARLDLFSAKERLVKTRYHYFTGLLRLKAAAGKLTEQDLETLDQVLRVATPVVLSDMSSPSTKHS